MARKCLGLWCWERVGSESRVSNVIVLRVFFFLFWWGGRVCVRVLCSLWSVLAFGLWVLKCSCPYSVFFMECSCPCSSPFEVFLTLFCVLCGVFLLLFFAFMECYCGFCCVFCIVFLAVYHFLVCALCS